MLGLVHGREISAKGGKLHSSSITQAICSVLLSSHHQTNHFRKERGSDEPIPTWQRQGCHPKGSRKAILVAHTYRRIVLAKVKKGLEDVEEKMKKRRHNSHDEQIDGDIQL